MKRSMWSWASDLRHGLLMPIRQDLHLLQTRHRLRFAELLRAGFASAGARGGGHLWKSKPEAVQ